MAVRKNIKKTTLVEFEKSYQFSDESNVRRHHDGRLYLPSAYCQNGHKLMSDDARIDGLRGIKLLVKNGEERHIIIASPFINDQRKEGPNFPEGTKVVMCCPVCQEELEQLVPCTCAPGAYRRAIYLTPNPKDIGAVGVCEAFGCPQSFVNDNGELLYEVELIDGDA
jgi:hypothetical protein